MMVLDPGPGAGAAAAPGMGGVPNGMMQGAPQQNMPMMPVPYGMSPYGFAMSNVHHPMQNAFSVPQRMPPPPTFQMYLPPNTYQYPPSSGTHPTSYNPMPQQQGMQQGMPFYPNMNMRQGGGPTPVLTHTVFELRAPNSPQQATQGIPGQMPSQQQMPQSQQVSQVKEYAMYHE